MQLFLNVGSISRQIGQSSISFLDAWGEIFDGLNVFVLALQIFSHRRIVCGEVVEVGLESAACGRRSGLLFDRCVRGKDDAAGLFETVNDAETGVDFILKSRGIPIFAGLFLLQPSKARHS